MGQRLKLPSWVLGGQDSGAPLPASLPCSRSSGRLSELQPRPRSQSQPRGSPGGLGAAGTCARRGPPAPARPGTPGPSRPRLRLQAATAVQVNGGGEMPGRVRLPSWELCVGGSPECGPKAPSAGQLRWGGVPGSGAHPPQPSLHSASEFFCWSLPTLGPTPLPLPNWHS